MDTAYPGGTVRSSEWNRQQLENSRFTCPYAPAQNQMGIIQGNTFCSAPVHVCRKKECFLTVVDTQVYGPPRGTRAHDPDGPLAGDVSGIFKALSAYLKMIKGLTHTSSNDF
ncbi:hypothetical protein EVAR_53441_1 [Eumeta japonica]|uniref:Uncharacterized protein n=1 Tax=Eumeta variegata TaxID=151549 RepID=A0A4C1Y310_EUMVA|nr:hypothetical protein EVAR_53441_1 [Eumeta japonica]